MVAAEKTIGIDRIACLSLRAARTFELIDMASLPIGLISCPATKLRRRRAGPVMAITLARFFSRRECKEHNASLRDLRHIWAYRRRCDRLDRLNEYIPAD
jgi:hypothetical protein